MVLPINEFQYAGTWDVTKIYNQYQFVLSPTDNNCYLWVSTKIANTPFDPATNPSANWILFPNTSSSSSILTQYDLPNFGVFTDPLGYTGPLSLSIGNFTVPADIVPNSTALLYFARWAVNSFGPLPNLNVLDYRIGFSSVPNGDSTTFYEPFAGFVVQAPNNANSVPLTIPLLSHTPANPANPDYTNLPLYVPLTNLQPNQNIYCNFEAVYAGDLIVGVTVLAPFLLYQKL